MDICPNRSANCCWTSLSKARRSCRSSGRRVGEGLDNPPEPSSPQPRTLLARSTGIGRQPGRLSRSRTSDSVRSAPGRSALWIDDHVGDLQQPGLLPLEVVAGLRLQRGGPARRPGRGRPCPPDRRRLSRPAPRRSRNASRTGSEVDVVGDALMPPAAVRLRMKTPSIVGPGHAEAIAEQGAAR